MTSLPLGCYKEGPRQRVLAAGTMSPAYMLLPLLLGAGEDENLQLCTEPQCRDGSAGWLVRGAG